MDPAILVPKSNDQENCEKTPLFEIKAAVSFLMPQGVLCLKLLAIRLHPFGLWKVNISWQKSMFATVYCLATS